MNKAESLMSKYSFLNFHFVDHIPFGLPGLNAGKDIFINKSLIDNEPTETELIAEEIAHYKTTVGDISNQSRPLNKKQELQARRLSYTIVISLDELIECYENEVITLTDLASYFEVSEQFVIKTIETYRLEYGLMFSYKGYFFDLRNTINIERISNSNEDN